jgi:hypothetical protein
MHWLIISIPIQTAKIGDVAQVKQIAVAPADAQVGMVDGLDGRWKDFRMVIDFLARMVYHRMCRVYHKRFPGWWYFLYRGNTRKRVKDSIIRWWKMFPICGQIDQMHPLALVALVDSNGRATPSPPVFSWSNGYVMSYTWGFWSKIFIPSHNQTLQWEIPKLNRGLGKFIYK